MESRDYYKVLVKVRWTVVLIAYVVLSSFKNRIHLGIVNRGPLMSSIKS